MTWNYHHNSQHQPNEADTADPSINVTHAPGVAHDFLALEGTGGGTTTHAAPKINIFLER